MRTIKIRLCEMSLNDGIKKMELADYIKQCDAETTKALTEAQAWLERQGKCGEGEVCT